jgi:hypothetical protein
LPKPSGPTKPNSAARLRNALASMVCCLTSSARAVCSAGVRCRFRPFTGTNFTAGRRAAARRAAASAASLLRPVCTNGRAAAGAIGFTVCPGPVSARPQWGAAPHASSTTVHAGGASKNLINSLRRSLRLTSAFPVSFTPCTWNTALAVSRPIMMMLIADDPFCVGRNSPHSGASMP